MSGECAQRQTPQGAAADIVGEQGLCLFDAQDVH
ncbi:hypothetical protein ABH944_002883 [Caballeronia udeis]|jgi:hypothetical protein|uniref:Uncharacterized protein n=1 Tax=Caballeronia udeis TaxID=1232866 RepID=A0ABW8MGG0_9BURK